MLTVEQFEKRRGKIGSSQIAAVIGCSSYLTPYGLWEILTDPPMEQAPPTVTMERGNIMERSVADIFCRENGYYVYKEGWTVTGDEVGLPEWFADTVDFLVKPIAGGEPECLEIKCVGPYNYQKWQDGFVPEEFIAQSAWHNAAHKTKVCHVVAFFTFQDIRYYRIERDEVLERGLIQTADEFIEMYVKTGEPPPIGDAELGDVFYKELKRKYLNRDGQIVVTENDKYFLDTMNALKSATIGANHYKRIADDIKRELAEAAGNHTAIVSEFGSFRYVETKQTKWKAVALELGATTELIEKHTTRTSFFRPFFKENDENESGIAEVTDDNP